MKFLLENPFILVVLIGIISSFYKQMKGTREDEQKNKRKQPKPFVPGQSAEKTKPFIDFDFGEIQKRFEGPQTDGPKPVEKEARNTPKAQESRSVSREESFRNTQKMERPPTGRLNQPKVEKKVSNESDHLVSSQTLRDAVVWSEILGPPRAKQIYNQKRANSRY